MTNLTANEAMERINRILSHAWMVRRFLKHAEEIGDDDVEMHEVHRMIFDYVRAVEPSYERKDSGEYLRRAGGKLAKFRKAAEYFAANFKRVSDHTNFQMAALSLTTCVEEIQEVLSAVVSTPGPSTSPPPAE